MPRGEVGNLRVMRVTWRRVHVHRQVNSSGELLIWFQLSLRSIQCVLGSKLRRGAKVLARPFQRHLTSVEKFAVLPRRHARDENQIAMAFGWNVVSLRGWNGRSTSHQLSPAITVDHLYETARSSDSRDMVLREIQPNAVGVRPNSEPGVTMTFA